MLSCADIPFHVFTAASWDGGTMLIDVEREDAEMSSVPQAGSLAMQHILGKILHMGGLKYVEIFQVMGSPTYQLLPVGSGLAQLHLPCFRLCRHALTKFWM